MVSLPVLAPISVWQILKMTQTEGPPVAVCRRISKSSRALSREIRPLCTIPANIHSNMLSETARDYPLAAKLHFIRDKIQSEWWTTTQMPDAAECSNRAIKILAECPYPTLSCWGQRTTNSLTLSGSSADVVLRAKIRPDRLQGRYLLNSLHKTLSLLEVS
jgi:hypothetical protein